MAVGAYYDQFGPVPDEEVMSTLERAAENLRAK